MVKKIVVLLIVVASVMLMGCTENKNSEVANNENPSNTAESVKWVDYEDGLNESASTGKPIMLYIYSQKDCLSCDKMENQLFSDTSFIDKSKGFVMIKLNVDVQQEKEIAFNHRVQYIPYLPTTIFLSSNGTELNRVIGYDYSHPSQALNSFLGYMDDALQGKMNKEDFSFTTINGETKHLSDYRGKVVLLDLMATWCNPCRMQMQELEKVLNHYGSNDDVVIISIDTDQRDDVNKIKDTFGDHINEWTFGVYNSEVVSKYLLEGSIPTLVIFDTYGRIAYLRAGLTYSQDLISIIDALN
ncbi:MAG: redoxin domain-containing protein [Thermoplasmata archaeon]|nr:redoxin domain-containing protein [Thermoplasmata archaeon]